jgi:hypothetical protein
MLSNLSSSAISSKFNYVVPLTKPSSAIVRYTFYSSGTTVPNMWIGGTTYNATLTGTVSISTTDYPPNGGPTNNYSLDCPSNVSNSTNYLAVPPITASSRFLFSVCHWIKKGQDTSGGDCVLWEISKSGGCVLFQSKGDAKFYVNLIAGSGFTLDTNWHHVAITYNFNTLTYSLYLDGEALVTNGTGLNLTSAPAGAIFGTSRIGRSLTSAHHSFLGKFGDFRIYNGILTADEVRSIYNGYNI